MTAEFRILEIRRGGVLAQPLDGAQPKALRLSRLTKYVENEIVVVESASSDPDGPWKFKVVAARIVRETPSVVENARN